MRRRLACGLNLLLATVLLASGCTRTLRFPVAELHHLDGFDVHNEKELPAVRTSMWPTTNPDGVTTYYPRFTESTHLTSDRPFRMLSLDGTALSLTSKTYLELVLLDGARHGAQFARIDVDGARFDAMTIHRNVFRVPLNLIQYAQVDVYSPIRTYLLTLGLITVAMLAPLVLLIPGVL